MHKCSAASSTLDWLVDRTLSQAGPPTVASPWRICEVNYRTSRLATAFLCHAALSKAPPSALSYLALDYGNETRTARSTLVRRFPRRVTVFSGDAWRSVLVAPLLRGCSVLVVHSHEPQLELQKRVLYDLPNALRRLEPLRGLLVLTGRVEPRGTPSMCWGASRRDGVVREGGRRLTAAPRSRRGRSSARRTSASNRTAPAARGGKHRTSASNRTMLAARGGKPARSHGLDWCTYWQQLADADAVQNTECHLLADGEEGEGAGEGGGAGGGAGGGEGARVAWCAGSLNAHSACLHTPPLLQDASDGGPKPPRRWHTAAVRAGRESRSTAAAVAAAAAHSAVDGRRNGRLNGSSTASTAWAAQREVVRVGRPLGEWRYFAAFDCFPPPPQQQQQHEEAPSPRRAAEVCLVFKDKPHESKVLGLRSADGLRFGGEPQLLLHKNFASRMTHNLAVLQHEGEALLVGGQYRRGPGNHRGVWLAHAESVPWQRPPRPAGQPDGGGGRGAAHLRQPRLLFTGAHPGCVERRDSALMAHQWGGAIAGQTCEFDGRLSLVHLNGRFLLYARANPAAHGQRFVQVASSTDGVRWSPFEMISIDGYRHAQGDIYYLAVQLNPVHNGSLLALFPLAHLLHGCVAIAASLDGKRWSPLAPLLPCDVNGERTTHQPAAGLLRRGEALHLYVHENVPGVTTDTADVRSTIARHRYLQLPPSRLVRYTFPAAALERWTRASLQHLVRRR